MNCPRCGAPMSILPDQGYFRCDYCGTYDIPSPNEDRVRSLKEFGGVTCPVCKGDLLKAVVEDVHVLVCENCEGVLIPQWSFSMVVQYAKHPADEPEPAPRQAPKAELGRKLHCPTCGREMDSYVYGGPGNVAIDACSSCKVFWLDHGELHRILLGMAYERLRRMERLWNPGENHRE